MKYVSSEYEEPINPIGNVAELFAGVGGFRIGLAASGWKTVFSNQWEPSTKIQHASNVYEARFGAHGHLNVDVATVQSLPEDVDLVVGGFPCQDYSVAKSANAAKGLEGKKGVLWWEILRLVGELRPKFVFLENVDRLLKSPTRQRGRDFAIMLKTLGELGYMIEWRVVNAAEYGFPQRRIRVLIVAKKIDSFTADARFEPLQYLTGNGILARALPATSTEDQIKQISLLETADVISAKFNIDSPKSPFANSGVYLDGSAYTIKVAAKYDGPRLTLGDVLDPVDQVPEEYWVKDSKISDWKYLKGAKSIERTHSGGGTYKYSEGSMAFPDLLTNPSRTILTGEGGSSPSRFKHIIEIHGKYRRLTPTELERLNGFPENWTANGLAGEKISDARRAFFMGNALVVGLIERVGHVLADEIRKAVQ